MTASHAALRFAAALALLAALLGAAPSAPALDQGEEFTTFLGETLEGEKIELAALRGEKAIVVDFWASWAPPSLKQRELLAKAFEKPRDGIVWVSVSLDLKVEEARARFGPHSAAIAQACDGKGFDGAWASHFGVVFAPSLYVIGKEGHVRLASNVALETPQEVERALRDALAGYDPSSDPDAIGSGAGGDDLERPATAEKDRLPPDFIVSTVNQSGKKARLSDYKNKVLLIVVFASWEIKSRDYLDEVVEKLYTKYRGHGFSLLAVSIEKDDELIQRELVKKRGYEDHFPITLQPPEDPYSITHEKYPPHPAMPRCYLIGKNGLMRDLGELKIERVKQVIVEDLNVQF